MCCWQRQPRREEIKEKARLLLEKAQRESIDLKNAQSSDEVSHPTHQQQQQLDSADTSVAESSASAREFAVF